MSLLLYNIYHTVYFPERLKLKYTKLIFACFIQEMEGDGILNPEPTSSSQIKPHVNFLVDVIFNDYCRSQIFEPCHI